jgi:hypothetical protein
VSVIVESTFPLKIVLRDKRRPQLVIFLFGLSAYFLLQEFQSGKSLFSLILAVSIFLIEFFHYFTGQEKFEFIEDRLIWSQTNAGFTYHSKTCKFDDITQIRWVQAPRFVGFLMPARIEFSVHGELFIKAAERSRNEDLELLHQEIAHGVPAIAHKILMIGSAEYIPG